MIATPLRLALDQLPLDWIRRSFPVVLAEVLLNVIIVYLQNPDDLAPIAATLAQLAGPLQQRLPAAATRLPSPRKTCIKAVPNRRAALVPKVK